MSHSLTYSLASSLTPSPTMSPNSDAAPKRVEEAADVESRSREILYMLVGSDSTAKPMCYSRKLSLCRCVPNNTFCVSGFHHLDLNDRRFSDNMHEVFAGLSRSVYNFPSDISSGLIRVFKRSPPRIDVLLKVPVDCQQNVCDHSERFKCQVDGLAKFLLDNNLSLRNFLYSDTGNLGQRRSYNYSGDEPCVFDDTAVKYNPFPHLLNQTMARETKNLKPKYIDSASWDQWRDLVHGNTFEHLLRRDLKARNGCFPELRIFDCHVASLHLDSPLNAMEKALLPDFFKEDCYSAPPGAVIEDAYEGLPAVRDMSKFGFATFMEDKGGAPVVLESRKPDREDYYRILGKTVLRGDGVGGHSDAHISEHLRVGVKCFLNMLDCERRYWHYIHSLSFCLVGVNGTTGGVFIHKIISKGTENEHGYYHSVLPFVDYRPLICPTPPTKEEWAEMVAEARESYVSCLIDLLLRKVGGQCSDAHDVHLLCLDTEQSRTVPSAPKCIDKYGSKTEIKKPKGKGFFTLGLEMLTTKLDQLDSLLMRLIK